MFCLEINILNSDESLHFIYTSKYVLMKDSSCITHFGNLIDISCINNVILDELWNGTGFNWELFKLFNHLVDNGFEGFLFSLFHSGFSKFSHCHTIVTFFKLLIFSDSISDINVVHKFHSFFLWGFESCLASFSFVCGSKKVFALIDRRRIGCFEIFFEIREYFLDIFIFFIKPDLVGWLGINMKLFLFFHRLINKNAQ